VFRKGNSLLKNNIIENLSNKILRRIMKLLQK